MTYFEQIGLVASICLPLWNVPLIMRIVQRQSSRDLSLVWVVGVWVCSLLMVPAGLVSKDTIFKMFTLINIFLFTGVLAVAFKYRK